MSLPASTSPQTFLEIQIIFDSSAAVAGLGRRIPAIDFDDGATIDESFVLQDLDKLTVGKIGDLSTPEALHALQIQVFDTDDRILKSKCPGGLKEPIRPLVGNILMDVLVHKTCTLPVLGSFLLA